MKTTTPNQEVVWENKSRPDILLIVSSVLFTAVCAISLFFFFTNMKLVDSIEANKSEIARYKTSIEKMKSDTNTIRAELIMSNKSNILEAIQKSAVQRYINELRDISTKYKMMFSGFSYSNGKITTAAVAIPEKVLAGEDGIKKISELIKDYRTQDSLLFKLAPVLSVSGYEQKRTFSIEFNVAAKPTLVPQK